MFISEKTRNFKNYNISLKKNGYSKTNYFGL